MFVDVKALLRSMGFCDLLFEIHYLLYLVGQEYVCYRKQVDFCYRESYLHIFLFVRYFHLRDRQG